MAPTFVEYLPATQLLHTGLPVTIIYVPAMQIQFSRTVLTGGLYELLGHAVQLGACCAENVSAMQSSQNTASWCEKVPAGQISQVSSFSNIVPPTHSQSDTSVLPAGDVFPVGHDKQDVPPNALEYVATGHN